MQSLAQSTTDVHIHVTSFRERLKAAWFLLWNGGFALETPEVAIDDDDEIHYREVK